MVLKNIADKKITSVHINPPQAVHFIAILDQMDCHKSLGEGLEVLKHNKEVYQDDDNPFYYSPFN